jgi:hypothetical protein
LISGTRIASCPNIIIFEKLFQTKTILMKTKSSLLVKLSVISFVVVALFISSCEKEKTPTKTLMEGVWTVKHVYDANGADHAGKVNFPITAFWLTSDNSISSTSAPLMMFVVYGDNKYTQIASDIDQVFNYTGVDYTGGEYFVADGVVDKFTLEMKLQGLPGQHALTELLALLNINADFLDVVVYHKFMDVGIDFTDDNNTMTWTIDDNTTALYNTKNSYGNYVLWGGWPVNQFTRCRIVLEKQVKDLNQVVLDAQ